MAATITPTPSPATTTASAPTATIKTTTDEVILDGSMLQIGGQLMRNGAAFSALLNKSIHITKIRNSGGLKPEVR
jgi:hypothetical protein